jgi:nanoRNase/pAp phosphatase (c-di-AMP/oligoRNAs hydrolase)
MPLEPSPVIRSDNRPTPLAELPLPTLMSQQADPSTAPLEYRRPGQGARVVLEQPKLEEFQQMLERHQGEKHAIVLQDFPDPDALSSAWVYRLIAQRYDIQCEIIYAGTLSHQENIALVKLTGLPLQRWTPQVIKTKDLSTYRGAVLIDNQGTTSHLMPLLRQAKMPIVAVIDHHSLQDDLDAEYVDIRVAC